MIPNKISWFVFSYKWGTCNIISDPNLKVLRFIQESRFNFSRSIIYSRVSQRWLEGNTPCGTQDGDESDGDWEDREGSNEYKIIETPIDCAKFRSADESLFGSWSRLLKRGFNLMLWARSLIGWQSQPTRIRLEKSNYLESSNIRRKTWTKNFQVQTLQYNIFQIFYFSNYIWVIWYDRKSAI